MPNDPLRSQLRALAEKFPPGLRESQIADVPRHAFHVGLIRDRLGVDVDVCDIGSGLGLFPAACASVGMRTTMMDDFSPPYDDAESAARVPDAPDAVNFHLVEAGLAVHRALGVRVEQRDPLAQGFGFPPGSLDVVTSFDSMEHWHRSPKRLFASVREALRPGGLFILGVLNCVNLRKRITVPLGRGKWSRMSDWYEPERFRGHVREPDVDDLHYIARDMRLSDVEIHGRNWVLTTLPSQLRWAGAIVDRALRLRPTLCADIYLVGRKRD